MHLNILNTTASRFIALLILLVGGHAEAQSWTGSVSTNWNNPANWSPASVPASGANINIYSGSSYYPSVTNSLTIGTLQLYGGSLTVLTGTVTAGPLNTYSGSTLSIGSGGTINSSGSLTLGGNVTVNGALACSGITLYNTSTLTINAAAKASNSGNLTIQGTLNLSGTMTASGISSASGSSFTINPGGTATTSGTIVLDGSVTVNGSLTSSGFTLYNDGSLRINAGATVTSTGTWNFDQGYYNITGGNFYFSGGSGTIPEGTFSSLSFTGYGTYALGATTSGAGTNRTSISGNLSVAAGTVVSVASGVNVAAGSLSLGGAGQVNGTWGSASSSAGNKNNTYFAGTSGYVTVTTYTASQTTTTTLGSLIPSTYGSSLTFTAAIAPAPGGGTVQFETNGVALGSPATVSGGTASLSTSALGVGSYAITALYGGTTGYSGSTSGAATQIVNKATVTILSGVTANNKPYDGTTTATIISNNVVLSGVLPGDTANIHLSTNSFTATFASATVANGVAVTVSGLTLSGSSAANYTIMPPTGLTANITRASPGLLLVASVNPSGFKGNVTFTASIVTNGVTAGDATGTVQFQTNSVAFGLAVGLTTGSVSTNLSTLPRGTNAIVAIYSGNGNYLGDTSTTLAQVVTNHPPIASPYNISRTAGLDLLIQFSDLTNSWSDVDGDSVILSGLNRVSTNGVTVSTNNVLILYHNSLNLDDQLTYGITDGQGGTNLGLIKITVTAFVTGQSTGGVTVSGGGVTTIFLGLPTYVYEVQRSTNLLTGTGWVNISTNTVGSSGQFTITDRFADLGGNLPASAYYRLEWHP